MTQKLLYKILILIICLIGFNGNIYSQETYDDYLDQGMELMRTGNFKEALSHFNKATTLNPEDISSYYLKGQCYIAQEKWDKAIIDFNMALDRSDSIEYETIAKTYYFIGYCHFNKNDTTKGLFYTDKCLKLDPLHLEALLFRIQSYTDKKMFEKAKPFIDDAIKQYPNNQEVLYYYGLYLLSVNENVKALDALEKSYNLGYRFDEFLNILGIAYHNVGKLSEALIKINNAITIAPEKNYYHVNKGLVLYDMSLKTMALNSFNEGIKLGAILPPQINEIYLSLKN